MVSKKEETIEEPNYSKFIILGIFGLIGLFCLLNTIVIIDAGEGGVLLTWGKIKKILTPGIHFKIPIAESAVKYDLKVHTIVKDCDSASKDLQSVITTVALSFRVDGLRLGDVHTQLGNKFYVQKVVEPSVEEAVKATTAQFTAEGMIVRREEVKQQLIENMKERIEHFGIIVELVNIENFRFSAEFDRAIEQKQLAEMSVLTKRNELEQVKVDLQKGIETQNATAVKQIIESEANAKVQVINAQAEMEAAMLRATGVANATVIEAEANKLKREMEAEAEAKYLRLKRAEITGELIELEIAENWDGSVPQYLMDGSSFDTLGLINLNSEVS